VRLASSVLLIRATALGTVRDADTFPIRTLVPHGRHLPPGRVPSYRRHATAHDVVSFTRGGKPRLTKHSGRAFSENLKARPWCRICAAPRREGSPVAVKCLGCGTVLRQGDVNGQQPRALCEDCKRLAKRSRGTRRVARSADPRTSSTRRNRPGRKPCSVPCATTSGPRMPASTQNATGLITTAGRSWRGVERRLAGARRYDLARSRRAS
jgi:hypothetical protein